MKTIEAIHISPVKSLGLTHPKDVTVTMAGIVEDRRFFLLDDRGRLVTQRQVGRLVQVQAEYQADPEWLRVLFPDGKAVEGQVETGDATGVRMWGRVVRGQDVVGEWNDALSGYCGAPVRLVRSLEPGQCFDEYPISLLSGGSVDLLNRYPGANVSFDSRRFRPNFLISNCDPHEEDTWLGEVVQLGEELRLQVVARDPRCVITTHDPDSGEEDFNTPALIAGYRPGLGTAYFGVYGIVERPGKVSMGDKVTTLIGASS
jgi:uncharacterized protein YcbX